MAMNLLQIVQENLGYLPLQKIDPNTQLVKVDVDEQEHRKQKFSQAAIPTVLIALSEFSQTDEGAHSILFAELSSDWADIVFGNNSKKIIDKIAGYSAHTTAYTVSKLNIIAKEAVRLVRQEVPSGTIADVKNLMADSRNDVLLFLPASMQMGVLLNDNTIDDRTNKMEGPISSLMHAIGASFSGSDTDETNISK